ncbi:MAG: hypothetical protein H7249_17050 [Chitinophagaceae bacterium]|nr:hypothetical protein [Oligoflexus sp.]
MRYSLYLIQALLAVNGLDVSRKSTDGNIPNISAIKNTRPDRSQFDPSQIAFLNS